MLTELAGLEARDISKAYGGVRALDAVSATFEPGSVHGVLGENGAGKSTLVKILVGAVQHDTGAVLLDGREIRFSSTADAAEQGVALVSQELNLFPDLDVLSNLYVERMPTRLGAVLRGETARRGRAVLEQLGLDVDMRMKVEELSLADRQLVEIARALLTNPRVLLLDEPTSALPRAEVSRLHDVLLALTGRGVCIIYVSHILEDVLDVCADVSILRDGRIVEAGLPTSETSISHLVEAMLGEPHTPSPPQLAAAKTHSAGAFTLTGVSVTGALDDVTLAAAPGEIVGVAGLAGSGHRTVLGVGCGHVRPDAGTVALPDGRSLGRGVSSAVRQGVGLVSGDRKRLGLMLEESIWRNVVEVAEVAVPRRRVLRPERLRSVAEPLLGRLRIKAQSPDQRVDQLSGGNQQKVVFAKWIAARPKVLLLDDPTRGVDVGAKAAIHDVMRELAFQGVVQLVLSSDLQELADLCDRVVILREGRVHLELVGSEATSGRILEAINQ